MLFSFRTLEQLLFHEIQAQIVFKFACFFFFFKETTVRLQCICTLHSFIHYPGVLFDRNVLNACCFLCGPSKGSSYKFLKSLLSVWYGLSLCVGTERRRSRSGQSRGGDTSKSSNQTKSWSPLQEKQTAASRKNTNKSTFSILTTAK